ncbi:COPII coat assembly protein SEC16 [Aspergillus clavatus NRRL 1]|uniref:COPII coat assembly protein sec16 n=1 Tax=Aspergillus clavatus (strain ATCC 1007 / CBS 513.65 / DSM 816 / NCTC 3887 / NRRL 1 / QM 1276 / 107) TaxID=344612 RepID=SEC16_ASPCL|nr:uncharacterized protein ACLA_096630 [Aspergillus clavatus NRRL 1]A1CME3.1 RecName: Full=COPII coat assembly protein sec16; AltName: Full=Protein transport protein sec16 [Aspergillus clavatus NRRL 1]EAW08730.1 conserved hypothetical protein [Aspergillus clavatus NRRL 1]
MTQVEGLSTWNPAFRPEDNESIITNNLAQLVLDPESRPAEVSPVDVHTSPFGDDADVENETHVLESPLPSEPQDAPAPVATDSDPSQNADPITELKDVLEQPRHIDGNDSSIHPDDTQVAENVAEYVSTQPEDDKEQANGLHLGNTVAEGMSAEHDKDEHTSGLHLGNSVAEASHFSAPEEFSGVETSGNGLHFRAVKGDTSWIDGDEVEEDKDAMPHGEISNDRPGFWGNLGNDGRDNEDDFFDQLKTQTKPIYVPPETESRFEEGVPLLDNSPQTPVEQAQRGDNQLDNVFAGDEDDEGDFFNEIQKSTPEEGPFHITRKSTTQVLSTLDTTPDSPFSETSPTAQDFNQILADTSAQNETKEPSDADLAARWQAELSDDAEETMPPEDDLAARWQAELDDDDDDLLLDEASTANNDQEAAQLNQDHNAGFAASLQSPFGTPENPARPKAQPISYTPHQPSTSDLLQGIPAQAPVPQPHNAPTSNYFTAQAPPNPVTTRAESFAERSKEGYKSPYDLPEDLARPRRPVVSKQVIPQPGNLPPPPPRSSSIPAPSPQPSKAPAGVLGTSPKQPVAAVTPKNFYEELPLPPPRPKSRPASSGRYTPNPTSAPPPAPLSVPQSIPAPANPYASIPLAPKSAGDLQSPPELHQPEKLDPYSSLLAPAALGAPVVPGAQSRYSPKPPGLQAGTKPLPSPRYSPAPPASTVVAGAPPPRNRYASQPSSISGPGAVLPFQPRTSSPLAHHEKISYHPPGVSEERRRSEPAAGLPPPSHAQPFQPPVIPESQGPVDAGIHENVQPSVTQPNSPPRNPYAPSAYVNEFAKRVAPVQNDLPSIGTQNVAYAPPVGESPFVPPRRSQTQSPSQQLLSPRLSLPPIDPLQRPASVHGATSPTKTVNPYAPAQVSLHNRALSQSLDFIPPTDGQQLDPLERWKGAPIVKFGFGGIVTSCFPKHIPRYSAGQAAPMIKSCPGEIKICPLNDRLPPAESIVQYPGPLKNKSKKKDLLAWLSSKIAAFENEGDPSFDPTQPDITKRHEEKILLWKIVRFLVEHDGALEGSAEAQKSLRSVMFPHLQQSTTDQVPGDSFIPAATPQAIDASARSDAADSHSIESLRDSLVLGEREKAVWAAVDNRLWGHAMIIASTMDRSVWKQVVQEFVRREVRSTTSRTESLAAFYEILAGNVEESIDELVPPSARAGLQMISKVDGQGPAKNTLDGLESWRETLGLVLSNRSPDDQRALLALGQLLLSYGRTEAAHICFIVSRAAVFGGIDDPQANIVLLGVDHHRLASSAPLHNDDSILLTEAYEYATSVLAGSPMNTLPYLLAFKLIHAWSLADQGRKSEAQQYCDAIAAALKAATKPSGYHNPHLFYGVDELSARLRQTASDAGSSWITRPSMEKVSGSMWAKFNSFVAGEESDAASTGSGKAEEIGPFAKVSGTPTVSRSPSVSDIYGSYPMGGAQSAPNTGASRYHPVNQYALSSSPEQLRGRSSLDSQRSSSYGFPPPQRRGSQEPSTPVEMNIYQGMPTYGSPSAAGYQSTPPQTSYMPLAPVEEDSAAYSPPDPQPAPSQTLDNVSPYQPAHYAPESFGQPFETNDASATSQFEQGGYMPPSSGGGYEPPFVEVNPASASDDVEDESNEGAKPKKKSFMDEDDDDDMAARAAAIQKAERARRDREADEAFRKAAEADAQKPPPTTAKKGWFTGWFGGKKEENNSGGGPIRAKLGEENSFYYDKELKKWVNKKDPGSSTPARGTPPPPRGSAPPSRTASGTGGPPPPAVGTPPLAALGAGSRPSSSAGVPPRLTSSPAPSALGAPPPIPRSVSTSATLPTPPDGSAGAPPRPATSLSYASSIDDLLGAPQARKGPAARGKKKGRYVDVMAK